jgi:hypothetical protein
VGGAAGIVQQNFGLVGLKAASQKPQEGMRDGTAEAVPFQGKAAS